MDDIYVYAVYYIKCSNTKCNNIELNKMQFIKWIVKIKLFW